MASAIRLPNGLALLVPSFGTTPNGGANGNYGTVFEITDSGFVVAPPPTGVSLSPATASLAVAQSLSGLAANAKLATVAQVGGKTGDSFSYTLGGTGASAFSLTSTNNVGTLSAGASGAAVARTVSSMPSR